MIDEVERRVTIAGAPVTLSKTEYRLLRALARSAGKTVSHEALLEQVWGPGYRQEIEFIWVYIRRLRRKIELDPSHPRYIQTAPGVGYLLAVPTPSRSGAQS
jgi:two-component system KDP operon response regulator KdpE